MIDEVKTYKSAAAFRTALEARLQTRAHETEHAATHCTVRASSRQHPDAVSSGAFAHQRA
jgi:hypothetical protein